MTRALLCTASVFFALNFAAWAEDAPQPATAPTPLTSPAADAPAAPAPAPAASKDDAAAAPAPVTPPPLKETEERALATSSANKDLTDDQAEQKAHPIPEGALEVTASGTLEWLRQDQMYVARQNATARHNGVTLKGDVLVAHYLDTPSKSAKPAPDTNAPAPAATPDGAQPKAKSGNNDITLVTADGNPVEIIAPTAVAYGKHGTYDVPKHFMQLLGDNLKIVTSDEVITAKDSLEYYEDTDIGVANGDAVLIRSDGDKLTADTISAKFTHPSATAKPGSSEPAKPPSPTVDVHGEPVKAHSLEQLDAKGHVVLVTQTDVVTGDFGTYNPITDITTVTGNVRITREQNQIDGAHAEVDMATGISRMFPAPHEKVRALFVPKKKDPNAKAEKSTDKTADQSQDQQ